jgi:hypothetical protein
MRTLRLWLNTFIWIIIAVGIWYHIILHSTPAQVQNIENYYNLPGDAQFTNIKNDLRPPTLKPIKPKMDSVNKMNESEPAPKPIDNPLPE